MVAATVVTLAGVIALLVIGKSLLLPFAVAMIVWYVIDALTATFRNFKLGQVRPFRHFGLIMALLVIIFAGSGVISMIGDTVEQVQQAAPGYQGNVTKILDKFSQLTGVEVAPAIKQWAAQQNLGALIGGIAAGIMSLAGNAGMVAIYVVFLLLEQRFFNAKMKMMFPDAAKRKRVQEVLDHIQRQIRQYIYLKTLVSALTGILSWAILVWVGVDYAPFWALLIFILNFIPTIGSLVAIMLPTLLALVQFDTFGPFLILLGSLGAVQMLIGNVLDPRLTGSSLNLSPLVVILALSLWGQIWGVIGMFLSVPITVIGMIVLANIPATRPIAVALSENGCLDRD